MLQPISKAKYPAITEEEEAVSIPLQTLAHAIFDATLVHTINALSPSSTWQPMKHSIVSALNKQKVPRTLDILASYKAADVVCLQEVASSFIDSAKSVPALKSRYHVVSSTHLDANRDQNSVIFLSRDMFPAGMDEEVTSAVHSHFPPGSKVPVSQGDIIAVTATSNSGSKYVIVSFHGDTNGLATIPVLHAVNAYVSSSAPGSRLVFGLDANTYETPVPGKFQGVVEFGEAYASMGYAR